MWFQQMRLRIFIGSRLHTPTARKSAVKGYPNLIPGDVFPKLLKRRSQPWKDCETFHDKPHSLDTYYGRAYDSLIVNHFYQKARACACCRTTLRA